MLIVEDLFLLLRRDDGKPENAYIYNSYGLAAAVVSDLILAGRVRLTPDPCDPDPRVQVVDERPTGQLTLDAALEVLRGRTDTALSALIADSALDPEPTVARNLADAGIVEVVEKRALGLVPARYPVLDPAPENRTRQRLRAVLAGQPPTPADTTLLSILQALGMVTKVLADELGDLSAEDAKDRIAALTAKDPAGQALGTAEEAVHAALSTMNSAVMSAVILPVIVSGGGNGSSH